MGKWSKLNEEKTEIACTWTNGGDEALALTYEDGVTHNGKQHPESELIFNGWLIHDYDIPAQYQEYSGVFLIEVDRINRGVVDWSQERIDAAILAAENLAELEDYEAVYSSMMYWNGKTDAQVDTIVNGFFDSQDPAQIALACRATIKMLAKSQRDNVAMFKLMRDNGILPK